MEIKKGYKIKSGGRYPMPKDFDPVRGVSWNSKSGKWYVRITEDGRTWHLGCFDHKDYNEAVRVRREAELRTRHRGQVGRGQRRYDAPPGMRACVNPGCTNGYGGVRYVGPESDFIYGGVPRSLCPPCIREDARRRHRATRHLRAAQEREYARKQSKRRTARRRRVEREERKVSQLCIERLRKAGWTYKQIGEEIGIGADTVRAWYYDWGKWTRRKDAFERLVSISRNPDVRGNPKKKSDVAIVPMAYQTKKGRKNATEGEVKGTGEVSRRGRRRGGQKEGTPGEKGQGDVAGNAYERAS